MAGMLAQRLYGFYVLVYSVGVFMVGLWIGQWWEKSWAIRQEASEAGDPETGMEDLQAEADIRKPSERTLK